MDSITKQKKYLSENLIVESLRTYGSSQEEVKGFLQSKYGSTIADYLNNDAWEDDGDNNTKVFLVRDKKTRKIAYYYALNCGILYKEFKPMQMSYVETECVEKLIKATRRVRKNNLSTAEQEAANNLLLEAYDLFDKKIKDPDRIDELLAYAQDQADAKKDYKGMANENGEREFVKDVLETYPAIDIKFLCKEASYDPGIALDFKFGVYVFWEIIVPHILKISRLVGCKYVYLFAADNSEREISEGKNEKVIPYSKDYDMDEEENKSKNGELNELKKLVSYYMNSLKFRPVSGFSEYTVLKPQFERTCYTLVQEVAELHQRRELIWSSHDPDNEMGEK